MGILPNPSVASTSSLAELLAIAYACYSTSDTSHVWWISTFGILFPPMEKARIRIRPFWRATKK